MEDFIKFGSPVQQLRDSAQTQQQGALEDPAAKVKLPSLLFKCNSLQSTTSMGLKYIFPFICCSPGPLGPLLSLLGELHVCPKQDPKLRPNLLPC